MAKELQKRDQYTVLAKPIEQVNDIVMANQGGGCNLNDLQRIITPAGGATQWTRQTIEGPKTAEVLEGIIVYWQSIRAYWPGQNPTGEPPQCSSPDGIHGIGNPGGSCLKCPYAQWGSANGTERGPQSCKQKRRLLILEPSKWLPVVYAVPPSGLTAVRRYFALLTESGLPYWAVITRIKLQQTKNPDGQVYSVPQFESAGLLEGDSYAKIKAYADLMKQSVDQTAAITDDFEDGE